MSLITIKLDSMTRSKFSVFHTILRDFPCICYVTHTGPSPLRGEREETAAFEVVAEVPWCGGDSQQPENCGYN